ncbi:MAG: hypothetical protein RBT65_14895 [Methanolobus sp.]|nr:hypothetical protein [Methanolobus sp.]
MQCFSQIQTKMEKKYVVKDFEAQTYYCGEDYGWSKEAYLADYFDTVEDAERFIERENGKFQIELVYVV